MKSLVVRKIMLDNHSKSVYSDSTMEKINNQMKGVRFRGLTWDEREIIVSGLLEKDFNASMIAGILNTSRQNIWNVVKRIKEKKFNSCNTDSV